MRTEEWEAGVPLTRLSGCSGFLPTAWHCIGPKKHKAAVMSGGPLPQNRDIFHGQELEERREGNGCRLSVGVMDEAVGRAEALMG